MTHIPSSGAIAVVIVGAEGRMGRFARELLARTEGFALAGLVRREEELLPALERATGAVGLDLTRAGLGLAHGLAMLACGLRPVIGTSGVDADETAELDRRARELDLGGIVVPNFSLGMHLLQRAAELAARHMPRAEIVELHHDRKRDAPSGTAVDTAERLRAARGGDGPAVPIHSVRLPGLYAHQEVIFGAPGETLTVRHDMHGPEAFAPGILAALRYARTAVGVARGLGAALGAHDQAGGATSSG